MSFFVIIHNFQIDERWRYVLTLFVLSFFVCWFLFAWLWQLVSYAHGDLTIDPATGLRLSHGSLTCVKGATNFAGFLLLSLETQVRFLLFFFLDHVNSYYIVNYNLVPYLKHIIFKKYILF